MDEALVVKVVEVLGKSGILPFECNSHKPGTSMQQLTQGDVLALKRVPPFDSTPH